MMTENDVQALAILDKDGKLENQFSSNDLKLLSLFGDFFENLELQISHFLAKIQQYYSRPRESLVCHSSDTLLEVVKRLTVNRVHRLILVDEAMRPICVVSTGDILRALWPFCAQ